VQTYSVSEKMADTDVCMQVWHDASNSIHHLHIPEWNYLRLRYSMLKGLHGSSAIEELPEYFLEVLLVHHLSESETSSSSIYQALRRTIAPNILLPLIGELPALFDLPDWQTYIWRDKYIYVLTICNFHNPRYLRRRRQCFRK
jgi:hypothetical protein